MESGSSDPMVYFDLAAQLPTNLQDPAQRKRLWDETHLVAALQGLVNRTGARLYVRLLEAPDDFWWEQMRAPGAWLAERPVERVQNLESLLRKFSTAFRGWVVWDERVPATSNLASTIAGCDDLLPLRFDADPDSLYQKLRAAFPDRKEKVRLLAPDGAPLFTGAGKIPGTALASSKSAKCDAYLWLIEHYVRSGKTNPKLLGYYMDGFWFTCWQAVGSRNHTLSNHDFIIANRGAIFDLNVWDDESPVDDPHQPHGQDAVTLKALLRACYDRFGGDGMIHVAGFVPWAFKYTQFKSEVWSASGHHEEVATEWRYAEILSCFNAYMDADALGMSAMANASFHSHFPLSKHYKQNPKPTRERLMAQGILNHAGRIQPRRYFAHYVGDYDSAAWLYHQLPRMWKDPARGTTPLSWAFNPNLAARFPFGMVWSRAQATTNDWFVAGDSGAGYLNPGYLTTPRPHSNLPSGISAWEEHCLSAYRQWDLSLTGFVIDGNARGLSTEGLDAYNRFSPDGIIAQQIGRKGVHQTMPYLRMGVDLNGSPNNAARTISSMLTGLAPRFLVCRSILQTPTWYAGVEKELAKLDPEIQVVDLYTLLWLVREYELHPEIYRDSRYRLAQEVEATPSESRGLSPLYLPDGQLEVTNEIEVLFWKVRRRSPPQYFYFGLDSGFAQEGSAPFEIEVEYFDQGQGTVVLEYDSIDEKAPHRGAYKAHPVRLERKDERRWKTHQFKISDARFAGSQNGGADFRFFNGGDDLWVRRVVVRKIEESGARGATRPTQRSLRSR